MLPTNGMGYIFAKLRCRCAKAVYSIVVKLCNIITWAFEASHVIHHLLIYSTRNHPLNRTHYTPCKVSGQAVQSVPLALLRLGMPVYGERLDGRPSR